MSPGRGRVTSLNPHSWLPGLTMLALVTAGMTGSFYHPSPEGDLVVEAASSPPGWAEDLVGRTMGDPRVHGRILENAGQLRNADVLYYASADDLTIGFAVGSVLLLQSPPASTPGPRDERPEADVQAPPTASAPGPPVLVRLRFDGSVAAPHPVEPLPVESSFLLGNDPSRWRSAVRSFARVVYADLYPGIDLSYSIEANGPKYEFVVRPGSDPSLISMTYEGVRVLAVEASGDLVIRTRLGDLRDSAPVADQTGLPVPCAFQVRGSTVGFRCDSWDRSETLVIDPLLYSTYLGGTDDDYAHGIAVGAGGDIYVAGYTQSIDFPTTPGAFNGTYSGATIAQGGDAFVAVLRPQAGGSADLLYATYYGGNESDWAWGVAVDSLGRIFVSGRTLSTDLPVTPGAYDSTYSGGNWGDAFVFGIDSAGGGLGDLVYATYLGGTGSEYDNTIAVDTLDRIVVFGTTGATDFPTTPGAYDRVKTGPSDWDLFVAVLVAGGNGPADLVYSTYLGGSDGEYAYSLATTSTGELYLSGDTRSSDFPMTPGAYDASYNGGLQGDAYLVVFVPAGGVSTDLRYATFFGGTDDDHGWAVAVGPGGTAALAGFTFSPDLPLTPGAFDSTLNPSGFVADAYVASIDPSGNGSADLRYATYLGGDGGDGAYAVAVDPNGFIFVTGVAQSLNFPVTPGAYDTFYSGADVFISKLVPNGGGAADLLYSTFFGGTNWERPEAITLDVNRTVYIAGSTQSNNLPTSAGAYDTTYNGGVNDGDVMVAKLDLRYAYQIDSVPSGLQVTAGPVTQATPFTFWCEPGLNFTVDAANQGNGSVQYEYQDWSDGGGQIHEVDCRGPAALAATYSVLYLVSIETDPPALNVSVDGQNYSASATFWWPSGTPHIVEAIAEADLNSSARWSFRNWSDGGTRVHTVSASAPGVLTARFVLEFRVTLASDPPGLWFGFDGAASRISIPLWWERNSSHFVNTSSPQLNASGITFAFNSWSDGGLQNHTVALGAPLDLMATFLVAGSAMTLDSVPGGLAIDVDGVPRTTPYTFPCPFGTPALLDATSPQYAGTTRYVFESWSDAGSLNHTVLCVPGATFVATFSTEYQVAVETSPANLTILVDGNVVQAGQGFWWTADSAHTLNVDTPQGTATTRFVWASWSDGGARAHNVTSRSLATFTATFATEYLVTVDTTPTGRSVIVDGLQNTAPYRFWCLQGSSHSLGVATPQGDAHTRWLFERWLDLSGSSRDIVCDGPARYTAVLATEHWIVVTSSPPGQEVSIDGQLRTTPFGSWRPENANVVLDVPSPQTSGPIRVVFTSWSDGGSQGHSIAAAAPASYTAFFATEFLVSIETSPSGLQILVDGASITAPTTFWWRENSTHQVEADSPQTAVGTPCQFVIECEFTTWSDGGARPHDIVVEGSRTYTANFREIVPFWVWSAVGLVVLFLVALLAFLRRRRRCPHCDAPVPRSAAVCAHCGKELAPKTPGTGSEPQETRPEEGPPGISRRGIE